MRHRVDDNIRQELERVCRICGRVCRIVSPLQSIPEIGIPGHQHIHSSAVIEYRKHFGNPAGRSVFPLIAIATLRNLIVRHLNDGIDVVESVEQRMRRV